MPRGEMQPPERRLYVGTRILSEVVRHTGGDDQRPDMHLQRGGWPRKRRARVAFDRNVASIADQAPSTAQIEFESSIDDKPGRILELDAGRSAARHSFRDIAQDDVRNTGTDVGSDRAALEQMP